MQLHAFLTLLLVALAAVHAVCAVSTKRTAAVVLTRTADGTEQWEVKDVVPGSATTPSPASGSFEDLINTTGW